MKAIRYHNFGRSIFLVAIVIFGTYLLQSCSKKITFATSSVVPAAEGSVKVKEDKNNNYSIELKVIRLADAQRLDPPRQLYIVWMETEQNGTKNIGQLKTSSSMLSKTLKSSMKTVSAFQPKAIFITAEDNADVQYPGGQVVLRTSSF